MGRKPDTSAECRVLLSFANADGGIIFVHWLRNELMKKLNYFHPNSVYLDNVACRNAAETQHHNRFDFGKQGTREALLESGKTVVSPYFSGGSFAEVDRVGSNQVGQKNSIGGVHAPVLAKGQIKDDNYAHGENIYIGAQNKNWKTMWDQAFSQAKVLIQVRTSEYSKSNACLQEVETIEKAGRNAPYVLMLTFNNQVAGMPAAPKFPHEVIPCSRQVYNMGMAIDTGESTPILKDAWKISDSDISKIVKVLKKKGC